VVSNQGGLITASLKVLGTYPNNNDKLIIVRRGSMTSGSTSFRSLDGIGSNIHVVGLDDLTIYTILPLLYLHYIYI